MEILRRLLDPHGFKDYIRAFDFGPLLPDKLVIHHTWRPTVESWDGDRSIGGLKRYYEGKNWPAGPHLFVGPDGIWLFSDMRKNGIHAGSLNHRSIGIEVVGDYDQGAWKDPIKYNALAAVHALMERLNLEKEAIFFHRDVSAKSCPGWGVTKEWLFAELDNFRMKPRLPGTAPVPRHENPPMIQPTTSAPSSAAIPTPMDEDVMIPVWAAESVAFIRQHHLFEIHSHEDVRDAVKFHRFYKLIQDSHGRDT